MNNPTDPPRPEPLPAPGIRSPELPHDPMELLSRSWSASAFDVSKALAASLPQGAEDAAGGAEGPTEAAAVAGSSFSFASSATSQLVVDVIMSQSREGSPRLSHGSGPLSGGGSPSDSPPLFPREADDIKCGATSATPRPQPSSGGSKTVGRWLKDRRERKKEEARAHNAQLHAAVSVAGVAAAVAAIAAATATASGTGSGKDTRPARVDMAMASAATLVATQCVKAAESIGAEHNHLVAVISSAVNVRSPGDIITITAAAAAALRGAAALKARALREVWNIAAVIPVENGRVGSHQKQRQSKQRSGLESNGRSLGDELQIPEEEEEEDFLGLCSQELLARGAELLKRTRKGALHWKIVSVYINGAGQVMLKMKSRHVAGTITKKKKSVVVDVCRDIAPWPGRHLLEGGERSRYFGLRTAEGRVVEFECRGQREYEMWTHGVSRLLKIVGARKQAHCQMRGRERAE